MHPLYLDDLNRAGAGLGDVSGLTGRRVLITGVTGMIGACLADMLTLLNDQHGLGMTLYGVSRRPEAFADRFPGVTLVAADLNAGSEALPPADIVVHAASNAHPAAFATDPVGTMLCNLRGTLTLLERLRKAGHGRLLFISTGEICGDNPAVTDGFSETDFGRVDSMNPRACYPESKRAAETLCASYAAQYGVDAVVARLSYVYGPTLSDANTRADAQFLRNALAGQDIVLKSDGAQVRTYTYVTEAVAGLVTILLRGRTGEAYNVASRLGTVSIRGYAEALARAAGVRVRFELPSEQERRSFSAVSRAVQKGDKLEALGWRSAVGPEEGLRHTLEIKRAQAGREKQA